MAPQSFKEAIRDSLYDLMDKELETFCFHLLDREGKRVRRSLVKNKSREEITEVLVKTYTEEGAFKVVVETLKRAQFNQDANNLVKAAKGLASSTSKRKRKSKARGASDAASSEPDMAGGSPETTLQCSSSDAEDEMDSSEDPAVSFIRSQKMALINCLGADLQILQLAQQHKVITDKEYRKIKSITSKDDAVTELIDVVMGKGPDRCSGFLQILKKRDVMETYQQLQKIMKDWKCRKL